MLQDASVKPFLLTSADVCGASTLAFIDKRRIPRLIEALRPCEAAHAELINKIIDGRKPVVTNRKLPWWQLDEEQLPIEAVFGLNNVFDGARSRPSIFGPAQIAFHPSEGTKGDWEASLHYQHHGEPTHDTLEGLDVMHLLPPTVRSLSQKAYVNYVALKEADGERRVNGLRLVIDSKGHCSKFLMSRFDGPWSCNDKTELQTPGSMIFDPAVATPEQLTGVWGPTEQMILAATARHLPKSAASALPVTWRH